MLTASVPETGRAGLRHLTLFLCGDVMTGRGIDQVLRHPGKPQLHEPHLRTARRYVQLAEAANGPIPKPVEPSYVWGDALEELDRVAPHARIVNLETAVTTSDDWWRGKEVHYRMHPANLPCLAAGKLDCCVLANNHVLDWGVPGLLETLDTLHAAGIATAGAGRGLGEAVAPAQLNAGRGHRVLVLGLGMASSGIPAAWAAAERRPGVNVAFDLSGESVRQAAEALQGVMRPGDVTVASIHWGANWGYEVSRAEQGFARALIDEAAVDVVHGHSSHHPKGIEVYRDRLILYGCGDFLNDYEGIPGYEVFRDDLVLMYFPTMDLSDGSLLQLELVPLEMRRFRLHRAATADAEWLRTMLSREGRRLGTAVEAGSEGTLSVRWG